MSLTDYALLNSTWLNLTNKRFQCSKLYETYSKRKDADVVIKHEKVIRGCGEIKDKVKVELDGINYYSCLCHKNFQHPLFNTFMVLSDKFDKGIMPFGGGVMEQPAQIIEILNLISKLKSDLEVEQAKEQQSKQKGNKHGRR